MKKILWIAVLAAVTCSFLFRPSFLRAQAAGEAVPSETSGARGDSK